MDLTKTASSRERILYIDVLETIAILLVVYCHYSYTKGDSAIAQILQLCSFTLCVPLFLMANGALLCNHSFNLKKHLKRTLQLLIAVTVWRLLYLIGAGLVQPAQIAQAPVQEMFNYLFSYNMNSLEVPADHFWYLYILVAIYLAFPVIKTFFDHADPKIYRCILWILVIIIYVLGAYDRLAVVISQRTDITLFSLQPLREQLLPLGEKTCFLFFFMLGPVLHEKFYRNKEERSSKWILPLILLNLASLFLLCVEKIVSGGSLLDNWDIFQDNYSRIATLGLNVSLFALCAYIPWPSRMKIVPFISKRTMNIYCIHMFLCYLWIVYVWPVWSFENLGLHLIKTLVIILLSIGITELFTYIPGLAWITAVSPNHIKKRK